MMAAVPAPPYLWTCFGRLQDVALFKVGIDPKAMLTPLILTCILFGIIQHLDRAYPNDWEKKGTMENKS